MVMRRFLPALFLALLLSGGVQADVYGPPAAAQVAQVQAWIGRQVISTTGVYTPTTGTTEVDVTCVGGGAAGGGNVATSTAQMSLGGGGGSGGAFRKRFTSGFSGVTFTIGAAGTGVSGAAGNNGSATSVVINATTYTANGGTGGGAGGAAAAGTAVLNGGAAGTATNGDLNVTGQAGTGAPYNLVTVGESGRGGSPPFGLGLGAPSAVTLNSAVGLAGSGFGSGGSGAAAVASQGAHAGGAGQPGVCLIDEYR